MKRIKINLKGFLNGAALAVLGGAQILFQPLAQAEISGADMITYVKSPVVTTKSAPPKVMLTMAKDHLYWFKAYNDFTDLTGDGIIETTYKDTFQYYGYFDPDKCYSYEEQSFPAKGNVKLFVPKAFAAGTNGHYCDSVAGEWSGNFLNWASMTRMDIVRKLLYGGRRIEDKETHTILERTYLPTDAHSFAKYYNDDDIAKLTPFTEISSGDDFNDGLTICNTTTPPNSGNSQGLNTQNNPPLMRIVKGNYSLWAAGERYQCEYDGDHGGDRGQNSNTAESGIPAGDDSPNKSLGLTDLTSGFGPDYNVYILTCVPGLIGSENNENCQQYPKAGTVAKPTGLLQQYGEQEAIHFGLMTGSYEKNISGGVLRSNIGPLDDELDLETGVFKADPNSALPSVGVIRTLDKIRLYGYRYGNDNAGVYFGSGSGDDCPFQLDSITEGTCNSWGNPISEIYMEALRYFGALQPTPAFQSNDANFVGGLDEAVWEDCLDSDSACAPLNIIAFNTSVNSYDGDQTGGITDLPGASDPVSLTDTVGAGEGIHGKEFFIGRNGSDDDEFCNAKTISSLGNAIGICPEAPTLFGSYHMAGMAHYARTNDIRSDLDGTQSVSTYAVQLATNVPQIRVPVSADKNVTILPAYRLLTANGEPRTGGGSLVDFKVVQPHTEVSKANCPDISKGCKGDKATGTGIYDAQFYVNWEDSEQGGDFDQDMWGIITYRLDTNNDTIEVATDAIAESTNGQQLFGFVISGTEQDGFHAYSGIEGAKFDDPDPTMPDCNNDPFDNGNLPSTEHVPSDPNQCDVNDDGRSHEFTIGDGSAELLENPLFYAAKWGGFDDINNNDVPDLQEEWDQRDTSGKKVVGGDGIPDNYFFVTNPAALEDALRNVFDAILERASSGTAAAVVANEQTGVGAVYQALYDPVRTDTDGNEAKWAGSVHALFIDSQGLLREDGNGNGTLDDYNTDKVVEIFFDDDDQRTKVRRFSSSEDDVFQPSGSLDFDLRELEPIWNARDQLSSVVNVTTQRNYTTSAASGRHILTWLDSNYDGVVQSSEQIAFDTTTFDSSTFGWLDQPDVATAQELVEYIRGEEKPDSRNRTVDYYGTGTAQVLRLGDIVNSSPVPIASPFEAYDLLTGDAGYFNFRLQYRNRREVVYVGANDGMLHAFNAGFFDASTQTYETTTDAGGTGAAGNPTSHPLGAELWAYVPKNLLPHLQWLKREDYEHVYYVDAQPRLFEAKVFADDADHPGGWGTILVAGFRLGGGTDATGITVDTQADGLGNNNDDNDDTDDVKTKSAYVVMDVTNPEKPPEVLAELTPPNLQFTTSFPTVVPVATPNGDSPNKWYLVFGSGPDNLGDVTSSQNARLYGYDLGELVAGDADNGIVTAGAFTVDGMNLGPNGAKQFVGDPVVADTDLNLKTEVLYFGTVGDADGDEGKLWRIGIAEQENPGNWTSAAPLLDVDQPFLALPTLALDNDGDIWVVAGTGRFFSNPDKSSVAQQTFYGFRDPNDPFDASSNSSANAGAFVDVTDATVFTDGNVDGVDGVTSYTGLVQEIDQAGGWKRHLDADGIDPAQRNVTRSTLINGIVFSTAFKPSLDLCGAEGNSELLAFAFNTGTTTPSPIFGTESCPSCPDGVFESVPSIDLGFGLASTPSIHVGQPGEGDLPGRVTVVIQKSTGETSTEEAFTGAGLNNAEISWREFFD